MEAEHRAAKAKSKTKSKTKALGKEEKSLPN
jgi:hypothetical protein